MTVEPAQDPGSAAPSSVPPSVSKSVEGPTAARPGRSLRWLVAPAVVLLVVLLVRAFLVTPFGIPSGSMEDTLQVGDRVLVSRLTGPDELRRGDVVVFDASRAWGVGEPSQGPFRALVGAAQSLIGQGPDTDYVKRVIGLPGDHVRCCAADGRLEINGVAVDEPYLKAGDAASLTTFDVTLPPDRFWVMGDHRSASADSRAHLGEPGGGTVPGGDMIGKVWVRYWPLDRLGSLPTGPLSSVPRNGE